MRYITYMNLAEKVNIGGHKLNILWQIDVVFIVVHYIVCEHIYIRFVRCTGLVCVQMV